MLFKSLTLLASIVLVPSQASAQSWLCIGELAAGLKYQTETKKWTEAKFRIDESRYIIRPSSDQKLAFEVWKFGSSDRLPLAECKEKPSDLGFLSCKTLGVEFKFNTKNKRYMKSYLFGYVEILPDFDLIKEGGDDPVIEIGKCSEI